MRVQLSKEISTRSCVGIVLFAVGIWFAFFEVMVHAGLYQSVTNSLLQRFDRDGVQGFLYGLRESAYYLRTHAPVWFFCSALLLAGAICLFGKEAPRKS